MAVLNSSAVRVDQRAAAPRRNLGQVFTPVPIAEWMVRWALADHPRRILDPAVGPGVFIEAIQRQLSRQRIQAKPQIDAYDVDGRMVRLVGGRRSGVAVRLLQRDFVSGTIREMYDAIVANPPYVRHHDLEYPTAVWRRFDRICGRRLSRLTNLYGLFMVKIWASLSPRGRAAVILPAEWLNADFGVALKAYLLEDNAIDAIIHFDPTARIFDDALTTSAIVLLRRGRAANEPVRLRQIAGVDALSRLDLCSQKGWRRDHLDPAVKWSRLFANYRLRSVPAARLGDIASCVRGIATGANDYFTLRESQRRSRRIVRGDVTPCITKAWHLKNGAATRADVRKIMEDDERVFLFSPRYPLTSASRKYIAEGHQRGIHRRYLPAHRPIWYLPEKRKPAPILVSVFARGRFRFVRNRAGVLNLTAFHGIYPRTSNRRAIRRLFDYLASDRGQDELCRHCRIYADGLRKVEPRDVEAMAVPQEILASLQHPIAASKRNLRIL